MWFKMSQKIIDSVISHDLGKSMYNGDHCMHERLWGFATLLCKTADGAADGLRDARDLAYLARISEKQAGIIWDILKRHGVLQECNGGYSCARWMKDAGILGEKKKKEVAASSAQVSTPKQPVNPMAAFTSSFGNGGRTSFA